MERFTAAGKHHNYMDEHNQDALSYKHNQHYSAMVLADGVSACAHAGEGAEIACAAVTDFLLRHGRALFHMQTQETADALVSQVQKHLQEAADANRHSVEDYSSTLACVLYDKQENRLLYFSIGDSLITATKNEKCYIVANPADSRNGCCVTTSWNAASSAKIGILDTNHISSVMICSDGAWHLMYKRSRMEQSVQNSIVNREYGRLKEILLRKERYDDCSFITMDLHEMHGEETQ